VKRKPAPDTATGNHLLATGGTPRFGSKRDVAAMVGLSVRTVDNLLTKGLPHLRLGSRRTRYDLDEVAQWFKQKFSTRRFGPVPKTASAKPEAA